MGLKVTPDPTPLKLTAAKETPTQYSRLDPLKQLKGLDPEATRCAAIAKNLDDFLTKNNPDNLLIGTGHNSAQVSFEEALSSPVVHAVLKKYGFTDIAIEARVEFDDEAQLVAQGEITPQELGQEAVAAYRAAGDSLAAYAQGSYERSGKIVATAAKNDIAVHFVESQAKDLKESYQNADKHAAINQKAHQHLNES